jgi:single-stranded DNA-binding protein
MNVIVISGNLGNDPDSRYSQEGVHVEVDPCVKTKKSRV